MFVTDFPGICNFFENAESTVKQKFKRKQEQYNQLGIAVEKQGRGKAATYSINVDLNIIKTLVGSKEIPQFNSIEDIKKLKSWVMSNSEFCFGCKKWINKDKSFRIAVPSASGQSEILCACCEDCYNEGYHIYSC